MREIEDLYGLSHGYGYTLVKELAKEKGVSYESMIYHPHSEHVFTARKELKETKPIDFSSFQAELKSVINAIDKVLDVLNKTLEEWTEEDDFIYEEEGDKEC